MSDFQKRLEANIRESLRFADGEVQDDAVAHMMAGVNAVLRHSSASLEPFHEILEIDGGRFEDWTLKDFAAQCRMQARDQLDPEFSRFMAALARRLSALATPPDTAQIFINGTELNLDQLHVLRTALSDLFNQLTNAASDGEPDAFDVEAGELSRTEYLGHLTDVLRLLSRHKAQLGVG